MLFMWKVPDPVSSAVLLSSLGVTQDSSQYCSTIWPPPHIPGKWAKPLSHRAGGLLFETATSRGTGGQVSWKPP